MAFKESSKF